MSRRAAVVIWRLLRVPALSPAGLLIRAAVLAAAYVVLHLAGFREYASVICGMPPPGSSRYLVSFAACAYIMLHLAAVMVVPALVIASGIAALVIRFCPRKEDVAGSAAGGEDAPGEVTGAP